MATPQRRQVADLAEAPGTPAGETKKPAAARQPGTRLLEVSPRGRECQTNHDHEEVVPSPYLGREPTEEPDPQLVRPHSAGRKDELRSSENAVEHQADGTPRVTAT